ncbi:MAG TPA: VOC family protein [Cyclobacteriaceae bacterium]|nr:VOC family protein [Cyclobacteriaceae bacterium]
MILRLTSIILLASLWARAQPEPDTVPAFEPYFSATVVTNLERSAQWYQSVFGLAVKERMNDAVGNYKIIILTSPKLMWELLELKGSLARHALLEGKAPGTQIEGPFKTGFKVQDINQWLAHLSALKIDVPHVWTDATTGKGNFIISDPDGNLIQFFD